MSCSSSLARVASGNQIEDNISASLGQKGACGAITRLSTSVQGSKATVAHKGLLKARHSYPPRSPGMRGIIIPGGSIPKMTIQPNEMAFQDKGGDSITQNHIKKLAEDFQAGDLDAGGVLGAYAQSSSTWKEDCCQALIDTLEGPSAEIGARAYALKLLMGFDSSVQTTPDALILSCADVLMKGSEKRSRGSSAACLLATAKLIRRPLSQKEILMDLPIGIYIKASVANTLCKITREKGALPEKALIALADFLNCEGTQKSDLRGVIDTLCFTFLRGQVLPENAIAPINNILAQPHSDCDDDLRCDVAQFYQCIAQKQGWLWEESIFALREFVRDYCTNIEERSYAIVAIGILIEKGMNFSEKSQRDLFHHFHFEVACEQLKNETSVDESIRGYADLVLNKIKTSG